MVRATHRRLTVSVIIPAFNSQATIVRAIDSVLAQTLAADEIIVVDDGSSEDLRSLLRHYGRAICCIRQRNAGSAAARNAGIRQAHGDLIAFLDADDFWEPMKLQRQVQAMHRHVDVDLVASRHFIQRPEQTDRSVQPCKDRWLDRELLVQGKDIFDVATSIWTGTVMVRREALMANRFVSGLEPAEDCDLWIRVLARHPAYIISEPLATAVMTPGALSRGDPDDAYAPMVRVLARHRNLVDRRTVRNLEANVFRAWAAAQIGARRSRRAVAPALQRLRRQPYRAQSWWTLARSLVRSIFDNDRAIHTNHCPVEAGLPAPREIERDPAEVVRAANVMQHQAFVAEACAQLFAGAPDVPRDAGKANLSRQDASVVEQVG